MKKTDRDEHKTEVASGSSARRKKAVNLDREAAFKAKHGRDSGEFYEHLSRLVLIPRIGHLLAACADPRGGFKSPAECRKIERRLAKLAPHRSPASFSIVDL